MDLLSEKLSEILETLINKGFTPPLYCAAISTNGSIMTFQYEFAQDGTLDMKLISSHSPEGQFTIPVNIMFVDKKGDAARVIIEKSGEYQILH